MRCGSVQVPIQRIVAVLEEDRRAAIAPLRHMMREARRDETGKAGHATSRLRQGTEPAERIRVICKVSP